MATFQGGSGPDNLVGGPDDDVLLGLGGDDTLNGGIGNDTLTGGDGADRFSFSQPSHRVDTITDFSTGQDLIVLDQQGFGFSGTGSLAEAGVTFDGLASGNKTVVYDAALFELRVLQANSFHLGVLGYSGGLVATIDPGHTVAWAGSSDLGSRPAPWQVVGTGDFDHDGNSDILWRNSSTGQLDEWRMVGGQWAGSIDLGSHGVDWQVAGVGDFNKDGTSDILFRNTVTGQIDEWVMANGRWSRSIDLGSRGTDWQIAAVGALDHEGTLLESSDILWRNSTTGQLDGWLMANGNWSRSIDLGSHGTDWQVAGIGQIGGHYTYSDGRFGGSAIFFSAYGTIVFRNPTTGQVEEWSLSIPPIGSGGQPSHQVIDLGSHGTDWQIAAIADFNGNGQNDILWRNPTTGQMDGWVLRDGKWAGSMTLGSLDPAYQVAATGDFNGDGAADVLWRNPSTGQTIEWTLVSTAPTHASDYLVANVGGNTADIFVPENTTTVTTVVTTLPGSPTLTYSIVGGSDAAKFQIDAVSGVLSFITAPDFENPGDADHNNSYVVQVRASDGGLSDDQVIMTVVNDVTEPMVQGAGRTATGPHPAGWLPAGIADFTHDGTSDLAWYNASNGDLEIWKIVNGRWAGSTDIGSHPAGWQPAGFADFNNDGTSDALWYNPTTRDLDLWKIANGQWAGSVDIGTHPAGWQPAGVADFNHDGTSDVLWYNPTTGNAEIWKTSNGQWAGSFDLGAHPLGWQPSAIGDFNGDGTNDIAWFNAATGDVDIWTIVNGQWAGSINFGTHPTGWQPLGAGDFNLDGTSDLVWYNPASNNQVAVDLVKNGQWAGSFSAGGLPPGNVPFGVGDFDHNGVSDVMWRNTDGHIENWMFAFS